MIIGTSLSCTNRASVVQPPSLQSLSLAACRKGTRGWALAAPAICGRCLLNRRRGRRLAVPVAAVYAEEVGQTFGSLAQNGAAWPKAEGGVVLAGQERKGGALTLPKPWREALVTGEQRALERYRQSVQKINALEPEMRALTDSELRHRTVELRGFLAAGTPLDDLLVEAFAVVREAARRVLGLRPYDVQLVGGMVLHEGKVAEMRTGEGKTLVAVAPAYLNALPGRGVHVVTVNAYLAARDCEWMGKVFEFLGMTVAVMRGEEDTPHQKRAAYDADVTYVTAQQHAFCHLRDNTVAEAAHVALRRPFHYAIVDEVDSVLIDECRNPCILGGRVEDPNSERYEVAAKVADPSATMPLVEAAVNPTTKHVGYGHFVCDRKYGRITLTERGIALVIRKLTEAGARFPRAEAEARAPGPEDLWEEAGVVSWGAHMINALRARALFLRNVHYIVRDGEVRLVDAATGRLQPKSRWTDGLHQAVEAKEGLEVRGSSNIQGSITYQMLFKYYSKLAGMTGTAATESEELFKLYGLRVVTVPPHRPCVRMDREPRIYFRRAGKKRMLLQLVRDSHWRQQPVLVGTSSVADSDEVSQWLKDERVPHQLLNARPALVAREAAIIAQAGLPRSVTIATSMAGRGTDIILGGNPKGLATAALEDLALPFLALRTEDEDWAGQSVPLREFQSEAHMNEHLPPQLLGALRAARAVLIAVNAPRLPLAAAKHVVAAAINRAETLRSQFLAGLGPSAAAAPLDELARFCNAQGLGGAAVLAAGAAGEGLQELVVNRVLARAALHLWVWFDARCEQLAAQVRALGGLRVVLASMQASKRGENQLRGRAGRQGDPGETLTLYDFEDRLVSETNSLGKLQEMLSLPVKHGVEYQEGMMARLMASMVHSAWEEGGRGAREQLALYDEVVDEYRQHMYSLRRCLVAPERAGRRRILHAYMLECAAELVEKHADMSMAPWEGDAWHLHELVETVRRLVNPVEVPKVQWAVSGPVTPESAALYRQVTGLSLVRLYVDEVCVMGPADSAAVADDLRRRLQARAPLPRSRGLHSTDASLAALREELADAMKLCASAEAGRGQSSGLRPYDTEARALAAMVGEVLVVSYEHGKRPAMADAMDRWSAATNNPSCRQGAEGAAKVAAMLDDYERDALVEILDAQWRDFLAAVKNLETGAQLRANSALEHLPVFRLESGAMFVSLLEAFRREAAADIFLGPFLDMPLAEPAQAVAEPQLPQAEPGPAEPSVPALPQAEPGPAEPALPQR